MIFNTLSGMPRSGSTLLCNILSQNEKLHVGSTSVLSKIVLGVSENISTSDEFKSEFINDSNIAYTRARKSTVAFMEEWYSGKENVINKSRGWNHLNPILTDLYPNAKQIVPVRDLRDIFASVEKNNLKNPMLDVTARNIREKASNMLASDGFIGSSASGIEDLLRRKSKNVFYVIHEEFLLHPQEYMKKIYAFLEQDYFEHDFQDIPNNATDVDGLYFNKYPHNACGKLREFKSEWQEYISDELAQEIMEQFPLYNNTFGYK